MEMKVFLAGRVGVELDGAVIGEERFHGRQGRLLFAYLAAEQGRPVPRDELAEAIWGGTPPSTWEKSLTVVASRLRALLAELGVEYTNALSGAFGCYRLELPEGTWVDVVAATDATHEAERALAASDLETAQSVAALAASLTRRPFLPGEAGAWVEGKRRELADVRRRALTCLADACLRSGDAGSATRWAEEAIALDPYRETGYRILMDAHAMAGNRAEGLRVYEQCRRLLAEDLGAYPSPETESIYRELLGAVFAETDVKLPESPPVTVLGREPDGEPAPAPRRATHARGAIAIGAAVLLATAIAVPIVELSGGTSSPGIASVGANSVAVIDSESGQLAANVPVGKGPTNIAAGEDSVWVANAQDDSVSRIDRRTRAVVERITVGSAPSAIAVDAGAVWVANTLEGSVSRIDPETNAVVETVANIVTPTAIAAGLGSVWITSSDERSVKRVDAVSGHVVDTIQTGAVGRGIAVGAGSVWVTDESSRSVVRIDPTSSSVVETVNVGNAPTGITFGAGSVWVANSLSGTVSRIDAKTNEVTATIDVGEGPNAIAAGRDGIWVSREFSGSIVRIDPEENRVVERLSIGNRPQGLAVSESEVWFAVQSSGAGHRGGRLVVANQLLLTSIDPGLGASSALDPAYDRLVDTARQGGSGGTQILPDLAASLPVVTAGGTQYAFRLRRGIRYSDGAVVRPSDFRRALERIFRARAVASTWFASLVGADACARRPRSCDLGPGVQTNDAARTIVFHLRRPDPQFLVRLGDLTAAPVPAGTPDTDVGTRPVPSTGPYMIGSYVPGRALKLVRNPYFRVWSELVRPNGYPDEIVFRLRLRGDAAVSAVERGDADVSLGVPARRLEEVTTRYASQLHVNPAPGTMFFVFLNTRLPPFDDVRARRALSYAVDRDAVTRALGGQNFAQPLCQIRPPSVAGYRPYCPYTIDPSATGEWKAPDLARARRLIAASGTKGMRVTLWAWRENIEPAALQVVSTLRKLGYRTTLRRVATIDHYFPKVLDKQTHAQAGMFGWIGASGELPSYVLPYLTCSAIGPASRNNNPGFFCDKRIDAVIEHALSVEATDPNAAAKLWPTVEREVLDLAPWVPLFTPQRAHLVSRRVGNYQYSPTLGVLLDQLWVR
jgi:peptide/nickel transport system substrate-binding protein